MDVIACPLYLAPVAQYVRLYSADRLLLDVDSPYVKQTYRNRAVIAAENGALALTVPVVHNGVQPMRDVRISDHGNWRRMHWNAIASAYKKSPFFDYYADDFRPFYENKIEFLVDFNMQLHATVCELLGLDVPVVELSGDNGAMAEDIRSLAQPVDGSVLCCMPYYQVFERRNGFLPNMSIADLLFNMGPEGLIVLRDSVAASAVR
ncbi:MAG: WbqC family protein [Bacteroidaceae bacterium]|nr:WbqC family protein [Bacteroidaceae bacterium]